jgi:hypothetical protein
MICSSAAGCAQVARTVQGMCRLQSMSAVVHLILMEFIPSNACRQTSAWGMLLNPLALWLGCVDVFLERLGFALVSSAVGALRCCREKNIGSCLMVWGALALVAV